MPDNNQPSDDVHRIVKIAFGVMALLCLGAGLVLYSFPDSFGFSPEMARYVALAFLAAGVTDYIVLRFWDRLVKRR